MRLIRLAFLAVIAVLLVTFALANRGPVVVSLLPESLEQVFGLTLRWQMPLFLVVFLGIVFGLLIGFLWEWMREYRYRAEAARKRREAERLARELEARKAEERKQHDVLALIE